jgi:hypothetical protein
MVYKTPLPYFPDLITLIMCHGIGHVQLEACEHFQKSSIRNRCYIRSANGILRLTTPVIAEDRRQTNIKNVRIAYHENWKNQQLHSIQTAYGNAPFFEHYIDDVTKIFRHQHETLWELNMQTWNFAEAHFLKNIKVTFSQTYILPEHKTISDRRAFSKETDYLNLIANSLTDYQHLPNYNPHFFPGLCCLDLLFFQGPYASQWLENAFQNISKDVQDY